MNYFTSDATYFPGSRPKKFYIKPFEYRFIVEYLLVN